MHGFRAPQGNCQTWDAHWHLKITQLWCQMQPLFLKSAPALTSRENIQILKDLSPELQKISIIIWQQEIWHSLCMFLMLEGMNIRPAIKTHVCRKAVTKSVVRGKVGFLTNLPWPILMYQRKLLFKSCWGAGGKYQFYLKVFPATYPTSFFASKDDWMSTKRQKVVSGQWPLWCFIDSQQSSFIDTILKSSQRHKMQLL